MKCCIVDRQNFHFDRKSSGIAAGGWILPIDPCRSSIGRRTCVVEDCRRRFEPSLVESLAARRGLAGGRLEVRRGAAALAGDCAICTTIDPEQRHAD